MKFVLANIIFIFGVFTVKASDNKFLICSKKNARNKAENKAENKGATILETGYIINDTDVKSIYSWKLSDWVNLQIRHEMIAFYEYLNMARFFHKYDQDRQGFAKYFYDAAMEELAHAHEFMNYQQMRGGEIEMMNLPAPTKATEARKNPEKPGKPGKPWRNAKDVLVSAYELEKDITKEILCLHKIAEEEKYKDTDFLNFLEDKIIPEQYTGMKDLQTKIQTLERACPKKDSQCAEYPTYEMQFEEKLNDSK